MAASVAARASELWLPNRLDGTGRQTDTDGRPLNRDLVVDANPLSIKNKSKASASLLFRG
jgi:hypothetical protein